MKLLILLVQVPIFSAVYTAYLTGYPVIWDHMTSRTVFCSQLGPLDVVSGMRKAGAEGGWPLDGRILGDVGGPRWSVGRWWAIMSDQQLKK